MPDLPTRKKREDEIMAALLPLFLDWRDAADSAGQEQPEPPENMAVHVAVALAPTLALTHQEAAIQLSLQLGAATSGREIFEKSRLWGERQGLEIGRQVEKTTGEQLSVGKSPAEVYSDRRVEIVATTEITRAITLGEAFILLVLAERSGRYFEAFWYTEDDALVCVICGPLHKQPRAVWILVAPAGPTAHPECRCWLVYEEIINDHSP